MEMSEWAIYYTPEFVGSHLGEATGGDELGRCIDDIVLETIPKTWPLLSQAYLVGQLFGNIYDLPPNIVSKASSEPCI